MDHVCTTVSELETALASAVAGDNILVRGVEGGGSGYYQTTNDTTGVSEVRCNAGFHFANSGTDGNPITLKAYPGDTVPTLSNRPSGSTAAFAFPTITFGNNHDLVVDGLKVDGAIFMFSDTYSVTGTSMSGGGIRNTIKNCEVWEGWETSGPNGNWSGIRVEGQQLALVQNNYIHDINDTGNCSDTSSMCGIKIYSGFDSVYEYNTIRRVVGYSQAACIDDKQDSFRNIHRFNWFEDVSTGPRIQNQKSSAGADPATGTQFYQNVIILADYPGRAFTQESGELDDYEFFNNTIIAQAGLVPQVEGMVYAPVDASSGAKFYNNIFYGPASTINIQAYAPIFDSGGLCDYNHYTDSPKDFRHGSTTYTDLADWQDTTGFDLGASSGDPGFVDLDAFDLRLGAGSPCLNTGKTGGTSGGDDVNKGAYITGVETIGYSSAAADIDGGTGSGTYRGLLALLDSQPALLLENATLSAAGTTADIHGWTGTGTFRGLLALLDSTTALVLSDATLSATGTVTNPETPPDVPAPTPLGHLTAVGIELGLGGRVRDILIAAGFTKGCWPLGELFDTTFRDVSGNNYHAALNGTGFTRGVPTGLPEGHIGLTFDGNGYLGVVDDGDGHLALAGGSMDVAFFIKTAHDSMTERVIISKRNATNGYYVGLVSGSIRFRLDASSATIFNFTRGSIADGQWHVVHCYYDPPTQEARIFIDGVQIGAAVSTTNTDPPNTVGENLHIGGNDQAGASNFIGSLAFVDIGREGNLTLAAQLQAARLWTNVVTDVRLRDGIRIRYGSSGLRVTDWMASSGTCTFVLDNSIANSAQLTGYYSPNHANCRTGFALGIPMRASFTKDAVTRYKHHGRIVSIVPEPGPVGFSSRGVRVTSADWLDVAARSRFIGAATQVDQLSTDVLKYLMDFANQSPGNVDIAIGTQVFGFALDQGNGERETILSEMNRLAQSETMYLYMRGNDTDGMTFVAETRFARSSDTALDTTLTDTMSGLEVSVSSEGILNEVRATCYPPTVDESATSVLFSLTATDTVQHPIVAGATVTIEVPYSDPNDRPSGVGGTALITPVATTDYTGHALPNGTGADLTSSLDVRVELGATAMRVLITNTAAPTIFLTKLQVRGKGIYRYQQAPALGIHRESIQKYGVSPIDLDMPYQQSIAAAQSLADTVADIYGLPTTRPGRVTVPANRSDELMIQAITREVGDHIGIDESITGITAGDGYFIHEVDLECHGLHSLRATWGVIPPWPPSLLVLVSGPSGQRVHDLDTGPLELSESGDYTLTFNRTGDDVSLTGAAGGGGGGGGEADNGANSGGGGGGGGGAVNLTGVTVAIATTVYTAKVGAAGSGGVEDAAGGTGGVTEFRVPAGTIHLQLPGGVGGGFGTSSAGGAGGAGGAVGTGAGNVAGTAGANGGHLANGSSAANNATGAAGGGGGASSTNLTGGNGGNSVGSAGGAGGAQGVFGTSSSGSGGAPGLPSGGNDGGGGGGGGGPLMSGAFRAGGGGGGGAGLNDGGTGGTGGGGALVITKI